MKSSVMETAKCSSIRETHTILGRNIGVRNAFAIASLLYHLYLCSTSAASSFLTILPDFLGGVMIHFHGVHLQYDSRTGVWMILIAKPLPSFSFTVGLMLCDCLISKGVGIFQVSCHHLKWHCHLKAVMGSALGSPSPQIGCRRAHGQCLWLSGKAC